MGIGVDGKGEGVGGEVGEETGQYVTHVKKMLFK